MIRRRALLSLIEYKQIEPSIHNNKIWYTSSNGNVVTPYYKDFGANIISNEYNNGKGVITFDGEVTMIGNYAFFDCSSLTSVTIGDSVTMIGDDAFNDCYSLTNVTIGDSVTAIGERAFFECSSLTSVTIPDSVTTIGNESFAYCNSLTSVTIGDSVITIGNYAFYGCDSLTSITIPNSVTTIGDGVFDDCDGLTSVYCKATTPPALGGTYVFDSNGSGRKIYVPTASVETYKIADGWSEYADAIVGYDFDDDINNTYSIRYTSSDGNIVEPNKTNVFGANIISNEYNNGKGVITFDEPITTIGTSAFEDCSSLTTVTIPDSVTTIGKWAFRDCSSLTSISIPDSVTSIGIATFLNCSSITSIDIPNNITVIESNAFDGCSSLTSITIPDSVTSIGNFAFEDCSSLMEFNGKFASEDGRCLIIDGTIKSFAPAGLTAYTIPDSVTTIGSGVFRGCDNLTSVTIPYSVTTIEADAFYKCSSLTSITIPDSVTTIRNYALQYCSRLTSVTIGDGATTIGDYAFDNCNKLTSVYCKAVTPPAIRFYTFYRNASARKFYVPADVVETYKSASYWEDYADVIVGYDFEDGGEESGNLITFTVDGVEYQAQEGMSWEEFINSEYNTGNFIIKNNYIYTTDDKIVNDNNSVHKMNSDEKVISGGVYYITFPEPE